MMPEGTPRQPRTVVGRSTLALGSNNWSTGEDAGDGWPAAFRRRIIAIEEEARAGLLAELEEARAETYLLRVALTAILDDRFADVDSINVILRALLRTGAAK